MGAQRGEPALVRGGTKHPQGAPRLSFPPDARRDSPTSGSLCPSCRPTRICLRQSCLEGRILVVSGV